jgi:hypothetical protein
VPIGTSGSRTIQVEPKELAVGCGNAESETDRSETVGRRQEGEMKKLLVLAVMSIPLVGNTRAEACLVKDLSGNLDVRSSPNGQIVGMLKNGTLG